MPKSKTEPEEDEATIMERMNKALKAMMNTPPETHGQMVKRRRHKATQKPKKSK